MEVIQPSITHEPDLRDRVLATMPRRARPRAIGTRFDQREIAIRVSKMRNKKQMERKAVYDVLGIAKGEYSRKENGKTPFTLWEISKIADLFDAPMGWPFITGEDAERLRQPAPAFRRNKGLLDRP